MICVYFTGILTAIRVGEAAFEVVRELIKPEKIPFGIDTVVPVMQFDRDKPNALPLVYATALAKHFDAFLETGIHQINVVSHTFADAQTRILGATNVHRKDPSRKSHPHRR